MFFQNRDTHFFRRAGVNRGFVHHDRAFFQILADTGAGADQRAEIRLMRLVHRGRDGHNEVIAILEFGGVGGDFELGGRFQVFARHLAGRVAKTFIALDFFRREIKTDGLAFLAEFHCQRQTHITQPYDTYDTHVENSSC